MEIKLDNGEILVLDEVARAANGSLLFKKDKTVILASVVMDINAKIEGDFLPLTVQYLEKAYANGKIPSGFIKREGKPNEFEILTSRLIDRSIRPLFPKNFYYPIQISVFVLSADTQDLQVLALNAASLALYLSNIPIKIPVNAVRVGIINDEFIINPRNLAESSIDLFVAGSGGNISMIEFKSNKDSLNEAKMIEALNLAKNHIESTSNLYQNTLEKLVKTPIELPDSSVLEDFSEIFSKITQDYKIPLESAIKSMGENNAILDNLKAKIAIECGFDEAIVEKSIAKFKRNFIRSMILEQNIRTDGRNLDEIRPISIATNILPNAHGSTLFTRGETQVLAVCTIGSENDAQSVENLTIRKKDRFMFHYNFPSFSTGEAYPIGSVSRRELGHGNLAKKALESSLKNESEKTIRIVSEVLQSNGSSSMASVCGGSLSLFAAGLSPEFLVAGIAMGLIKEGEKYAILTDIMGVEDYEGDMDFKVAGNISGITALQMDIKISEISIEILQNALLKAKDARLKILSLLQKAKDEIILNDNRPTSETFSVPTSKIPVIIGQSGKNIKQIIERFDITIDIAKDSGKITLFGTNKQNLLNAKEHILSSINIDSTLKVGDRFNGRVKKIADFGIFVEIKNGIDGLIHNAKLTRNNMSVKDFSENQNIMVEIVSLNNDKIELFLC